MTSPAPTEIRSSFEERIYSALIDRHPRAFVLTIFGTALMIAWLRISLPWALAFIPWLFVAVMQSRRSRERERQWAAEQAVRVAEVEARINTERAAQDEMNAAADRDRAVVASHNRLTLLDREERIHVILDEIPATSLPRLAQASRHPQMAEIIAAAGLTDTRREFGNLVAVEVAQRHLVLTDTSLAALSDAITVSLHADCFPAEAVEIATDFFAWATLDR